MIDSRRIRRRPAALVAVLALLLALTALGTAGTATAASDDCGKAVIADWFDNGRVDRIYELQCYREAVKALPVDVRDYSSAKEDIMRALLHARQGETDPGDNGSGGSGAGGGGTGSGGGGGTTGSGSGGSGGSGGGTGQTAAPHVDTAGPSSVPVPLLVLAGLATLLLALGAAGYLTRRRSGQGADEPSAPA